MRQFSAKAWVGGTVLLSVLLLVAAWFLLIDPVVARAAEDTVAAEDQRQQNDLLELEIAKLKEEFVHLDEYKAELQDLRAQMPVTGDASSISRELNDLATGAGVVITSLQPSLPETFVSAAAAAAAAAPATDAATTESADGEATADGAAAAPAPEDLSIPGFYQVPIAITSIGTYDASVSFLKSVQQSASRLYLVSSITATTQDDKGAEGGRPATTAGDVELAITGYAYVLSDLATQAPAEGTDDATLPVPGGQANPFQPGR